MMEPSLYRRRWAGINEPSRAAIESLASLLQAQFADTPLQEILDVLDEGAHDLAGQIVPASFSEMLYLLARHRLAQRPAP